MTHRAVKALLFNFVMRYRSYSREHIINSIVIVTGTAINTAPKITMTLTFFNKSTKLVNKANYLQFHNDSCVFNVMPGAPISDLIFAYSIY